MGAGRAAVAAASFSAALSAFLTNLITFLSLRRWAVISSDVRATVEQGVSDDSCF